MACITKYSAVLSCPQMLKDDTRASKPGNLLNDRGYQVENCEEIENKTPVQCRRFFSWVGV